MDNKKDSMHTKLSEELKLKLDKVENILQEMGSVAIAFSGGVDSTLLLKIGSRVLGEKALAIYADSPLQPHREKAQVIHFAEKLGIKLLSFQIDELSHIAFRNNPPNRCYYCKSLIFKKIEEIARENNIDFVVDGSNHDDKSDFRPGARALKELGVRSPLQEAGLTKAEIRQLSKHFKLPTWDKDALACLATRIPYGEAVTEDKLKMIDKAEEALINKGFRNVRARFYGDSVKVEVRHDQVSLFSDKALYNELLSVMNKIGFSKMIIDPKGYRQGSLNEV